MKRIAITMRVAQAAVSAKRDCLEQDYVQFYQQFGIALLPIPNVLANVAGHIEAIGAEGIILSGGNDIDPKLYGGKSDKGEDIAPERDSTEAALLGYAAKKRLPVLCECRGAQFLNAHFGGKLEAVDGHVAPSHKIAFEGVGKELFQCTEADVNSYHNFGFHASLLSPKLQVFAKAKDGVIEGVFHPNLPIAGVLWHPERKSPDGNVNRLLVEAFIKRKWFWE